MSTYRAIAILAAILITLGEALFFASATAGVH
jgi:hypothetical protein